MRRETIYQLAIGHEQVSIRQCGRRVHTTARVLARETTDKGVERIWLDRIVAPYGSIAEDGWRIVGAIASILERAAIPAAPASTAA